MNNQPYRTLSQCQAAYDKSVQMLTYWETKSPEFWLAWKGKNKKEIISGWKTIVSQMKHQLENHPSFVK